MRVVPESKLTSGMKFSERVDAGERPYPNIVVSISTLRLSKLGASVVADDDRQ